jgi:hypothetical protein
VYGHENNHAEKRYAGECHSGVAFTAWVAPFTINKKKNGTKADIITASRAIAASQLEEPQCITIMTIRLGKPPQRSRSQSVSLEPAGRKT